MLTTNLTSTNVNVDLYECDRPFTMADCIIDRESFERINAKLIRPSRVIFVKNSYLPRLHAGCLIIARKNLVAGGELHLRRS